MAILIGPNQDQYDEFGRRVRRDPFAPSWMPGEEPVGQVPPQALAQVPTPARVPPMVLGQPAQPTPIETAYIEALRAHPQYTPPGKPQRVLAAIAGGAETYLRGSEAGTRAAQTILETPYQRQRARWQERIAALEPQVKLMQTLHERGVDISKLGLGAAGIEATLGVGLARVAETREGRAETIRHNKELERIQTAAGDRAVLRQIENERHNREVEKIADRQAAAAELRAKKAGPVRKTPAQIEEEAAARARGAASVPKPISQTEQAQAAYLGTMDVMQDPTTETQLPAGADIMTYLQEVKDSEGTIVGYRLSPKFDSKTMDRATYDLLRTKVDAAVRKRLGRVRGGEAFTIVEEEEEEE